MVLYRKLLDRNPADVQLHKAYNSLLYRLGRMDEFLASYDRAPQTREILLGKARFLSLQKRSDEVEAIYNTLLARDPLDTAALSGWANNLMALGRTRKRWRFRKRAGPPRRDPGGFQLRGQRRAFDRRSAKGGNFLPIGTCTSLPSTRPAWRLLGTAWRLQGDERTRNSTAMTA